MNPTLPILFLILLLTPVNAECRRRPFELTDDFCANVPGANLDKHAFAGTWFQIFLTTGTDPTQLNKCATSRFTLQPDGTFTSLLCEFDDFLTLPRCIRGALRNRAGGASGSFLTPDDLPVDFVALLGSKSYGYFAAAAFQCNRGEPRTPGYFILARKPFLQRKVLLRLKKKLRCLGFPVPKGRDFILTQVARCKYFFNKGGFDIFDPGMMND